MPTIITDTQTNTTIDEDGNERSTITTKTRKFERSAEPEYIKIYTDVWCELNQIPANWQGLFLQLAIRMTYADTTDVAGGQIVSTGGLNRESICKALHIKDRQYQNGLAALCKCNAIKKIRNAFYQINPTYAGKGEWKYNPQRHQGGIEDIVATFSLKNKTIDTKIVWADDNTDNALNTLYRQGLNVSKEDQAVLKEVSVHE